MLAEREKTHIDIQKTLDAQTEAWGIKVSNVEIKDVDLNETMVRAIARQAEAERERRAKIIHAEGELQASEKLLQRADSVQAGRGDAAALPADLEQHRGGQDLDHRIPGAHGSDHADARGDAQEEPVSSGAVQRRTSLPTRSRPCP